MHSLLDEQPQGSLLMQADAYPAMYLSPIVSFLFFLTLLYYVEKDNKLLLQIIFSFVQINKLKHAN